MRNQGQYVPVWVGKTSYRCNYMPDPDTHLPYLGWSIDSHTKFSLSQFLMMICPISLLLALNSTIT
jgi:hypothetical protein